MPALSCVVFGAFSILCLSSSTYALATVHERRAVPTTDNPLTSINHTTHDDVAVPDAMRSVYTAVALFNLVIIATMLGEQSASLSRSGASTSPSSSPSSSS